MSIVTISVRVPSPDGTLVPAKGQLRWTPTRRRDVDGAVVIPHPFTVTLVDGEATVDVEPSTAEWAWMVDEYFSGIPSRTIHVAVPPVGPAAYTALTQLDPATLLPTAEPEAIWNTQLETKVDKSSVGVADGVAPLGADSKVPGIYLPEGSAGTVSSIDITDSTLTGRAVLTAVDAATARGTIGALAAAEKAAANGVASLGADGIIPAAQLPTASGGSSYEMRGTGSPNGVVTANPGTYYTDTAGTAGAWRWVKTSGTGNTGWTIAVGDTGWRSVTSVFNLTDFSGMTIQLRRTNQSVIGRALFATTQAARTHRTIGEWPVGFAPVGANGMDKVLIVGEQSGVAVAAGFLNMHQSGLYLLHNGNAPNGSAIAFRFETTTPWPAILPGAAA